MGRFNKRNYLCFNYLHFNILANAYYLNVQFYKGLLRYMRILDTKIGYRFC
nr:MAG TPA: hypothetical protein [Caudoviricetes sp.]